MHQDSRCSISNAAAAITSTLAEAGTSHLTVAKSRSNRHQSLRLRQARVRWLLELSIPDRDSSALNNPEKNVLRSRALLMPIDPFPQGT
jgi:hypothetical protein